MKHVLSKTKKEFEVEIDLRDQAVRDLGSGEIGR